MKLRHSIASAFVIIASLAWLSISLAARGDTGRAVSLNALASAAKSGRAEAQNLCGITKLTGFLVDAKNHDVVVIGEVDSDLPALHIDDLAIAMRSAWLLYARVEGLTRYYTPPGCSIDPDPNVLRQLQQLHVINTDRQGDGDLQDYVKAWCEVGCKPQSVRVLGVPFDTRFAKVMVDADYYMKRLVNGTVQLGIGGFESLSDMTATIAKKDLESGRNPSVPSQSLNRFWFSPGESTYSEEDDVVLLKTCQVRLLTEEEFLTERGEVAGHGHPNPMAQRFSQAFTEHYGGIAASKPIYSELEALFRFVALAKLMNGAGVESSGVSYLLKTHDVRKLSVERKLPGLTSAKMISCERQTPQGLATISLALPTCGGVSIDIQPKRVGVKQSRKGKPSAAGGSAPSKGLKQAILGARKSPGSLSWDFPGAGK